VRAYGTEAGSQPATVHHFDLGLGLYAKEEKKNGAGIDQLTSSQFYNVGPIFFLDLGRPYTYTGTVDGSIAHVHTDYPSRWFNSLILERPSVVSLAGLNMGGNTRARKKLTRRNKKQLQHQSSTTKGGKTKIERLKLYSCPSQT
jgi:hypothetical protein